jgi:molybdenum cofactor biosynthesis enzyme
MSKTNYAIGEQVSLPEVLNKKLESPVLQTEMGLDTQASQSGQAVRYEEFSVKHNNDGSFKGIDLEDMKLNSPATATQKPIRWDEFSLKHNSDGSFKAGIIQNIDINDNAGIKASKLAIHNNYKKSVTANPSTTANTNGTMVTLIPSTGYLSLNPLGVDVVFGGTFGTETVTATIKVTFGDLTTATLEKTATAVGTTSLNNTDLMQLIKDGTYIKQIDVYSKSSIASSAVAVTFNHFGFYL